MLGHLVEIAKGSRATAEVDWNSVPLLSKAIEFARDGLVTGASARNWTGYGTSVQLGPKLSDLERTILTDPQTSGGLLVACDPATTPGVLAAFGAEGFDEARVIGRIRAGDARVIVN